MLFNVEPHNFYKVHVRSKDFTGGPAINTLNVNLPGNMLNNSSKKLYVVLDYFKLLSPNSINDGVYLRSNALGNQGYSSFNGLPNIVFYIPPADISTNKVLQYVNQTQSNGLVTSHVSSFDLSLTDKDGALISTANLTNGWEAQFIFIYLNN